MMKWRSGYTRLLTVLQGSFSALIQQPYFTLSNRTIRCDLKLATYPLSFVLAANDRISMGLFPKVASLFHCPVLFFQVDSSLQELIILTHSTKLSILLLPRQLTMPKLRTS